MPTLGNSAKPTFGYYGYGGTGFPNQNAELLTNTTGEAINLLTLGAWVGGWEATCRCRLIVWSASTGAVLATTAEFVVANEGAAGAGQVSQYEVDLTTPLFVANGASFYVGVARNRNDDYQISTGTTANPHYRATGSYPSGGLGAVDGFPPSSTSRRTGMYVANYEPAVTSHTQTTTLNAIVRKKFTTTTTLNAIVRKKFTTTKTLNALVKKKITGSVSLNAIVKKKRTQTIALQALVPGGFLSSRALDAVVKAKITNTGTLNAVVKKAATRSASVNAYIVLAGQAVWTSPQNQVDLSATPTLTFLMPVARGNMHFQISLTRSSVMDGGGSPALMMISEDHVFDSRFDQTGWQYWNGTAWVAVPVGGVPNQYSGNEARLNVSEGLAPGPWYRRVRAGA